VQGTLGEGREGETKRLVGQGETTLKYDRELGKARGEKAPEKEPCALWSKVVARCILIMKIRYAI